MVVTSRASGKTGGAPDDVRTGVDPSANSAQVHRLAPVTDEVAVMVAAAGVCVRGISYERDTNEFVPSGVLMPWLCGASALAVATSRLLAQLRTAAGSLITSPPSDLFSVSLGDALPENPT